MVIVGIYQILNKSNGKRYIGQGVDIIDRWRHHISELNHQRHRNSYLQYSWNKYGQESFQFSILEECSESELNELEMFYIDKYRTYIGFEDCQGYNMTLGGEGSRKLHPVLQFTLSGEFVKEWDNGIIASQTLEIDVGCIYGCCIKRLTRGGNYIWIYKEEYKGKESLSFYMQSHKMRPVLQYDLYANLIKKWDSCSSLIAETGINPIACLTHDAKSYKGYIYKYENDPLIIDEDYCYPIRKFLENRRKQVYRINKDNNLSVKVYKSIREAEKDGFTERIIQQCVKRLRESYKGFYWLYENDYIDLLNNCLKPIHALNVPKGLYSVSMYNLQNEFIKEFQYLADVEKEGFNRSNVRDCCMGYTRQYKGFIWKFGECKPNPFCKEVIQFDKEGNELKRYPSLAEASAQTGINEACIGGVCNHRQKTTHGYIFKYASEYAA